MECASHIKSFNQKNYLECYDYTTTRIDTQLISSYNGLNRRASVRKSLRKEEDVKQQLSPAIAITVIAVLVIIVGVFLFRGANSGPGDKPIGAVGNAGPFEPGGAANSKGGSKPAGGGSPYGR